MKKALLVAIVAVLSLGGCVAVPAYSTGGYGYDYDYYYPAPAATFSFGFYDYDGPRFGHRQRHHRGPRHGHRHRR